jgi:hypothetical protein
MHALSAWGLDIHCRLQRHCIWPKSQIATSDQMRIRIQESLEQTVQRCMGGCMLVHALSFVKDTRSYLKCEARRPKRRVPGPGAPQSG